MSSLKDQVVEALRARPNQKADALARTLGVDRTDVNKLLYGPLKNQVAQDRAYRWSLVASAPRVATAASEPDTGFANTDLARLCRYYLACLGYDDTGVWVYEVRDDIDGCLARLGMWATKFQPPSAPKQNVGEAKR